MATADGVKSKLQGLISSANAKTGGADTTLTAAVNALIAGFGQGGGSSGAVKVASGSYTLAEDALNMRIDISALDFIPDVVFVSLDETGITYTDTPTKRWALVYAPMLLDYLKIGTLPVFSRTNLAACWRGAQGTETQQTGAVNTNYVGMANGEESIYIHVSRSAGSYPLIAGTYNWYAYKIYEDD